MIWLPLLSSLVFAEPPDKPADADPDAELAVQLKQAEASYVEGVKLLKAGDADKGREALKKAFAIAIDNVDDDGLPASFHAEFASILEKVRNWEASDDGEDATGLDVSEAALKAAPVASTAAAHKMRDLSIEPDNPVVQKFLEIYGKRRGLVEEALARSGRYRTMIEAALKEKGLPSELFYLVMAESEYKYDAVSRSKAVGLWQFMAGTARKYGLEVSFWVDERYDPEKSTRAALQYLTDLYQWFGDWNLALAAYNRGEGGLGRDLQFSRSTDFGSLSGRNALPQETDHYVPKFMACVLIGKNPEKYGFHPKYEETMAYDTAALPRDLDLGVAARCAQTTEAELHRLNPQLRAWCTPKDRPGFLLRIPKGTKELFDENLAKVADWNPGPTMVRYKVHRGDSLGKIARKYHTSVHSLLETNKIKNARRLRPGMTLVIRPGRSGRQRT